MIPRLAELRKISDGKPRASGDDPPVQQAKSADR